MMSSNSVNAKTSMPKIYIFDPCFGRMTGHWENYCRRLYREFIAKGYEVFVYGQTNPIKSITGDVDVIPIFETDTFSDLNNMIEYRQKSDLYLNDFKKIDKNSIDNGSIFMFHSIFPSFFEASLLWANEVFSDKSLSLNYIFQFSPADVYFDTKFSIIKLIKSIFKFNKKYLKYKTFRIFENDTVRYYKRCAKLIKENKNHKLLFMANADTLADCYSEILNYKVHYLPMPGEVSSFFSANHGVDRQEKIKVGYFGHSSYEKGGAQLYSVARKIINDCENVEFIVHLNPNNDVKPQMEKFKSQPLKRVRCYEGHLTEEKILSLIKSVDIVLLPYDPIKYLMTPSAIFMEAVPYQKIIVVTENTWAHRQATQYELGVTSIKNMTVKSINKALKEAIVHFEKLQHLNALNSQKFHAEHNMSNYVNMFLRYRENLHVNN